MARAWVARLWPAAAFQFCFIGAVAALKPGTNALVLSRFQSDALPWLYVMAAAIAGGLALVGGGGRRRSSPGFLAAAGAVVVLGLALGLWLELPLLAVGAYLFVEAFATQVAIGFWGAVGEAFDAREARRAFSWINGVGMSGAIVGGLGAQLLARTAGALALLGAGAVFLLGAALAWRFHRSALEAPAPRPTGTQAGWREVLGAPYTQWMGALVLGLALLQQLTDFIFRARAAGALHEADMAHLFAAHQLWTGVFCVLFQFALAEVLLRKLGILRYVALVPVGLAGLTVATWVVPSVWSAWALKVFEAASSWSLMPVAVQLLYAPLADELRDGARRTIDGVVRKGGMGVAGVLLLGLAGAVGLVGVYAAVLAVCAGVVVVLWRLRPRYLEAVQARVAGIEASRGFAGEERLLAQELASPLAERALRAAELLERAALLNEGHVRQLLQHPHERVQERGVALAEARRLTGLAKVLEAMVVQGARRPRDAAAWALGGLAPDRARSVLPPLLASGDVGLVTAAVGGLLSMPGPAHPQAEAALARLLERGSDAPAAERREVARLLGRLGPCSAAPDTGGDGGRRAAPEAARPGPPSTSPAFRPDGLRAPAQEDVPWDTSAEAAGWARGDLAPRPAARLDRVRALQRYLEDGDGTVRRLAIEAAGAGRAVALAPRLLRFLSWRDDRRAAREALARLGDEVVPLLAATLDDRSRSLSLRLQLPRVLRRIGSQAAFDALLYSNARDDPSLHYRVGIALAQLHEGQPGLRVDGERLLEALARRQASRAQALGAWLDARAALGEGALLTRVLGDRLDQAMELSFWLLGLRHDARSLRRAHALLLGSDSRRRAWALELLDTMLEPEAHALVAPWLDTHHRALPPGVAARFAGRLPALCLSDDQVLRACARRAGRAQGSWREPPREDDMNETTVKKLFALEGVEIFAQSDVDDLAAVAAVAREQAFHQGERIYAEGDPGDALYVVVEGVVEARREGEVVLTMRARESFGETSLFDGAPRVNEAVAVADTRTLVIDRRDFLELLADRPELLTGMFRVLSRQLKSMVVEVSALRANTGEVPATQPPEQQP